jgi:YD repeat-containing protein
VRFIRNDFGHRVKHSFWNNRPDYGTFWLAFCQRAGAVVSWVLLLLTLALPAARADVQYVNDENDRLVEVVDAAGNSAMYQYDDAGNLLSIQRHTPDDLAIAEFTPDRGPVGTAVTIYGIGFSTTAANNAITFNGVAAPVIAASPTMLTTTVPTGATTGLISVTVGLKTASSAKLFTVAADPINPPPVITSFTPTIGSVGTPVTITGANFDTIPVNNNVQFNNLSQATVTSSTLTQISTTVPTNASSGHLNVRTFYGAATSSADFFVLPSGYTAAQVAATARVVVDGPSLAVNTGTAGKVAMVLFDGVKGQSLGLGLSALTTSPGGGTVKLTVYKPDNTVLTTCYMYQWISTSRDCNLPLLPADGTYTILVDPGSSTASFDLLLSADLTGTLTANGAVQTFTSNRLGQNARYTFIGSMGQGLGLGMSALTTSPTGGSVQLTIYNPDNTVLTTCYMYQWISTSRDCNLPLLPADGTYTILVDPGSSTASVDLLLSADLTGTLTADTGAQTYASTRLGQNARYTFTGTIGQSLGLGMSTLTTSSAYGSVKLTIYNPDNTVLTTCYMYMSSTRDCNLPLLPASGTYLIFVDPGSSTASFDLLLSNNLSGTLTADADAQIYTSTRLGQNGRYTFTGTIGQSLGLGMPTLTTSSAYGSVKLTIYNPDNTVLTTCYMYMSSTRDCNLPLLPASGTYLIFVDPGSSTASFDLLLSNNLSGTLTADADAQIYTSTRLGQNGRYTFTGTIGQSLGLGMPTLTTSSAYGSVKLTIYNPDNIVLTTCYMYEGISSSRDCNLPLLPADGTYLIFVDPGSSTASFDLLLSNDLTGTWTVDGAAQTFFSTRLGQNARYTFTGTIGQGLGVGLSAFTTSPVGGSVKLTFYKPDNTVLTTCYMYSSISTSRNCSLPFLPADGTYTVIADPGSSTASFGLFMSSDITGTLTLGGNAQAFSTDRLGQNARYAFSGTAGQNLSLLFSGDTFPGWTSVYVYKPDGSYWSNTSVYYSGSGPAGTGTWNLTNLPATGTYTVFVSSSGGTPGAISLQIP